MRGSGTSGYEWWASLKHGGMLIAPSRLREFFPEDPEPLPSYMEARLRRHITRAGPGQNGGPDSALMDTVFEGVLGLGRARYEASGRWLKASQVSPHWTYRAVTGEAIRPARVWLSQVDEVALPVFTDRSSRLGIGRSRRQAARVVEWLRRADRQLALFTNGSQWRLIYAGLDHDAFAEWDTALWFEEGAPGPQITALRALLSRGALEPTGDDDTGRLLAAIEATRKGQAELSSVLGERVRKAVELLIRSHGEPLAALDDHVEARHIYLAAVRIIMRMVVTLFAEARDLLPRDNAIYHASYGLGGLRDELDPIGGGSGAERLRHRQAAWPRVLALFRLVYEGSPHEQLPVTRYGGGLFEPGDPDAERAVSRALSVFEDRNNAPADHTVYELLRRLTQSKVRVRQGRASTWVDAPVDFSDLSSEYIGILYEGLLDYELRRVDEADPVVFLNLGDQPALPVSRLEALDESQIENLVEKLKKRSKGPLLTEDSDGEDDEEEEIEEEGDDDEVDEDDDSASEEEGEDDEAEDDTDARREARERAEAWAVDAVKTGKLVRKPRSRSREALAAFEAEVKTAAERLIGRVVLPGEWYLVRFGGTRKGSGTFYTKPGLAVPTTRRTLRPLAYATPVRDGAPVETAPPSTWEPRPPEEILNLKVCDPACGSGSFLVAALRFLTKALAESLHAHGRIELQGENTLITLAEGDMGGEGLGEELLPCRPDAAEFDDRLRARLKRYVVERCVHGVDHDPIAVELCRLALWVETMDRELPFSFLDHKIRIGNALVGCWFDQFRHYPALAFEREGGDKSHSNGVHFENGEWTKAIKSFRNDRLKAALAEWIAGQGQLLREVEGESPRCIHDAAEAALDAIHQLRPDQVEERRARYQEEIANNPALRQLRDAFDAWCAIWFWPPDALEYAPLPADLANLTPEARRQITSLADAYHFFHWELEFPDVFDAPSAGFDAVIGNPPWEIQKPNSKEFFSNLDPLYRGYGKQEALRMQTELFERRKEDEEAWLRYQGHYKALSNFLKHAAWPFGDPTSGGNSFPIVHWTKNKGVHAEWRQRRRSEVSFADPEHPYRHQGSADINSYKLFLEKSHALVREGGRFGLITPSGLYTDKGSTELRRLFVERCRWQWLFGFENREAIFDIHRSFKFCPVIIEKGGRTDEIHATFMQRDVQTWDDAEEHVLDYGRDQLERFSPNSFAILELRDRRDLEILEKMYANSVLLGDQSDDGWKIEYRTEFHMTNDSKLFPPRPKWEADGYRPDEYSRWLLGSWRRREVGSPAPPDAPRWELEPGVILSRDETEWIHEDEIEDVALPLYEGRMIGQFDFSEKGWVRGKGRSAVWRDIEWSEGKPLEPQFLMASRTYADSDAGQGLKLGFMDVTSSTNARTMISSLIPNAPSGNKVPLFNCGHRLLLCGLLNSLPYDFQLRSRFGGLSLNYFILEETALPRLADLPDLMRERLRAACLALGGSSRLFAPYWVGLQESARPWQSLWAVSRAARLRLRAMLHAVFAHLYGLDVEDFSWVVRDCTRSADELARGAALKTNPKGLWRIDKEAPVQVREPVLALVAFRDLRGRFDASAEAEDGVIARFLREPDHGGWSLPGSITVEELRSQPPGTAESKPLPAEEVLGPRLHDWQERATQEESWQECRLHARNLLGTSSKPAGAGRSLESPRDRSEQNVSFTGGGDTPSQPELGI